MNEIKCHVSVAGGGTKETSSDDDTRDEKQYGVVEVVTTGKPVTLHGLITKRVNNDTQSNERN
ncbi:unnamed protein product, partial [Heterotrigona itama]